MLHTLIFFCAILFNYYQCIQTSFALDSNSSFWLDPSHFSKTTPIADERGCITRTPATTTRNIATDTGKATCIRITGEAVEIQVTSPSRHLETTTPMYLPSPTNAILAASIGRATAAGAQYCGATPRQAQYTNIATTIAASAVMHCCRQDKENRTLGQFIAQLVLDGICYKGINWLLPIKTERDKAL